MSTISLIFEHDLLYLDHLAPLSSLLNIPLVCCDEEVFEQAKKYYPNLKCFFSSSLKTPHIFDAKTIISCLTKHYFDLYFFPFFQQKTVWCPHGNSDKPVEKFQALKEEETLLIYGKQMKEQIPFKEKKFIQAGNFRYEYFLQHKKFYQKKIKENILSQLDTSFPIFFYAPTWQGEGLSSYPNAFYTLIQRLPKHVNLVVKLHPNIFKKMDIKRDIFIIKNEVRKNLVFVKDFTPIYPLLSICDVYIGDFSSIGYDFLLFDKPMFFFSSEKDTFFHQTPLSQCGIKITQNEYEKIYEKIEKNLSVSKKVANQKTQLYNYTFFAEKNWKKNFAKLLSS